MTTRREFVVGASTLLAYPLAADAQQTGKVYRIGILASYPVAPFFRDPFVATLRDLGYVEGQNIALRFARRTTYPSAYRTSRSSWWASMSMSLSLGATAKLWRPSPRPRRSRL